MYLLQRIMLTERELVSVCSDCPPALLRIMCLHRERALPTLFQTLSDRDELEKSAPESHRDLR